MLTALASEPSRSRVRSTTIPNGLRVVIGLFLRQSVPARPIFIGFIPTGLASIDSPTTRPMMTKEWVPTPKLYWFRGVRVIVAAIDEMAKL
jgi:hypothetical protein